MWGNILTEVSYIQNFNMGFTNHRADVLIHLTQYQYWWWFWFSFLWVLYYFLVARVFRYRTLKFNPRITSTLRPRGKWGDLLTCLIPVSWCLNILVNSNFILRLIEWQSESSLFTLRIRAKQWYWVYKLDLRNISDIFSAPRNVGRNKWQFAVFGDLQTAEDYLHIMQMRAYNNWSKEFWSELGKKATKKNNFSVLTSVDSYNTATPTRNTLDTFSNVVLSRSKTNGGFEYKYLKDLDGLGVTKDTKKNTTSVFNIDLLDMLNGETSRTKRIRAEFKELFSNPFKTKTIKQEILENIRMFQQKTQRQKSIIFFKKFTSELKHYPLGYDVYISAETNKHPASENVFSPINSNTTKKNELLGFFLKQSPLGDFADVNTSIKHPELDDETRILKRNAGKTTPLRVLKKPKADFFFKNSIEDEVNDLFFFRFNTRKSTTANKPIKTTVYLTFKQKRYNQRTNIGKKTKNIGSYLPQQDQVVFTKYSGNPFLKSSAIIEENFGNPTRQYRMLKKAKSRLENIRVSNWNRLLRSRRVLVLPAHVNITVITNSFDLVHSWFIPGLGLKMDCLPGRATHHTLYIDNVGLYYGQCAEICGRYHHHMPVRICALPFEHFLVWWHTFGLPKFLFSSNKGGGDLISNKYLNRKFSW